MLDEFLRIPKGFKNKDTANGLKVTSMMLKVGTADSTQGGALSQTHFVCVMCSKEAISVCMFALLQCMQMCTYSLGQSRQMIKSFA